MKYNNSIVYGLSKHIVLSCLVLLAWCFRSPAQHDKDLKTLTDMSIEELLGITPIPSGVMGTHVHREGEIMLRYRYKSIYMSGMMKKGHNKMTSSEVLGSFMVTPTRMSVQMHMFDVMFGLTRKITIMGMVPYRLLSMDHLTRMGSRFNFRSVGIGDMQLMIHCQLLNRNLDKLTYMATVSLPTGSIHQKDDTPAGKEQQLPYVMQLGSGTIDLVNGLTGTLQNDKYQLGGHGMFMYRPGVNRNDYNLGNKYHLTIWLTRKLTKSVNLTLRANGLITEQIKGTNKDLNPKMVTTANSENSGGTIVSGLIGVRVLQQTGKLEGLLFMIEGGVPLYQNNNGMQLRTDIFVSIGTTFVFNSGKRSK